MSQPRPRVIAWYRAYCAVMAFAALAMVVLGVVVLLSAPALEPGLHEIVSSALIGGGATLAAPFAVALFLRESPRAWVYHLILICLGLWLPSFPAAIALFVFWIKPDVQRYFGRDDGTLATTRPPVLAWHRAYCVVMSLLLPLPVYGVWHDAEISRLNMADVAIALFAGIWGIGFLASFLLPRRPWAWIYHLVLIGGGVLSCFLPAAVPLLIAWIRPDVQWYFGRRVRPSSSETPSAVSVT